MTNVHTLDGGSIAINGKSVSGLTLAAVELAGNRDIDGLLGMDYLDRFRSYTVEGDRLYLTR